MKLHKFITIYKHNFVENQIDTKQKLRVMFVKESKLTLVLQIHLTTNTPIVLIMQEWWP